MLQFEVKIILLVFAFELAHSGKLVEIETYTTDELDAGMSGPSGKVR